MSDATICGIKCLDASVGRIKTRETFTDTVTRFFFVYFTLMLFYVIYVHCGSWFVLLGVTNKYSTVLTLLYHADTLAS